MKGMVHYVHFVLLNHVKQKNGFAKSCQAKKWLVAIPGVEDSIIEHILVCFLGEVTQKVYALMHIKFTSCRVMCVNNVTIVDDSLAALISAHK